MATQRSLGSSGGGSLSLIRARDYLVGFELHQMC